jgi:pimeloyl-ACP methyl ester carboxylesterase
MCLIVLALLGCQGTGGQRTADAPQARNITVNGAPLTYIDHGTGPTVVMVHGAFSDARNWDGIRAIVAQRYRVVVPSLRYHYPNAWPDDGEKYSLAQHVEDVAALIRSLDAGKVHIVGNSMGSRIIGYVALKYPDLVRSLVLGDPFIVVPTSEEAKAALASFQKDAAQSAAAARAGDMKLSAKLLVNAVLDDPMGFDNATPAAQQRTLDNAATMGPYSRQPPAAPVTCDQFRALKMPALVILGEKSRAVFRVGAEMMATCLDARIARIPGGRHDWFAALPDDGARAILGFLDQQK